MTSDELWVEIVALRERVAEAEIHAARYEWLRKTDPMNLCAIAYRVKAACQFDNPDEAIDAARAADNGPELQSSPDGLQDRSWPIINGVMHCPHGMKVEPYWTCSQCRVSRGISTSDSARVFPCSCNGKCQKVRGETLPAGVYCVGEPL